MSYARSKLVYSPLDTSVELCAEANTDMKVAGFHGAAPWVVCVCCIYVKIGLHYAVEC